MTAPLLQGTRGTRRAGNSTPQLKSARNSAALLTRGSPVGLSTNFRWGNGCSTRHDSDALLHILALRASLIRHAACPWSISTIQTGCPTFSEGVVGCVGEDQRGPAGFCGERGCAVPPASADIALQLLLASRFPARDGELTSLHHDNGLASALAFTAVVSHVVHSVAFKQKFIQKFIWSKRFSTQQKDTRDHIHI